MEPDDFQLISSTIIQTVQVTVLDDGLPIAEDKTITLTLTFSGVDTDDIVLGEALLIIPGRQGRWLKLCTVIGRDHRTAPIRKPLAMYSLHNSFQHRVF